MTLLRNLTNDAAPSADDLLYLLNDPAGTPGNRKATVAALAGSAPFSSLYAAAGALGSYQLLSEKGAASGYLGLDTAAGGILASLPPERRNSYPQRTLSVNLARVTAQAVRELVITDSFGHTGASAPETTSWLSIYEIAMSRKYNRRSRLGGYVPVELWTSALGVDVPGIAWDTIPAGQHEERGTNLANKRIDAAQSATVARRGTGVTVFYTAAGPTSTDPGAVVNVTINGASGGTIDSRDAGLGSGFDSGRSVYIPLPTAGQPALCTLTLTHSGTGTSFEVEGAYFHGDNQDNGHQLLRSDVSGLSLQGMVAATGAPIVQVVGNYQPHAVTIMLGVNDGQNGRSAAQMAADLSTLAGLIRAEYGTWKPTIRYLFQWSWATGTQPATWTTAYRAAMRAQCTTDDLLFVDMRDLTGDLNGGDLLDLSDDALHPNDYGNSTIGVGLAHISTRAENTRLTPFDLSSFRPQLASNLGTTLYSTGAAGHILKLAHDAGAAESSGALLGAIAFGGAQDAFGNLSSISASVNGYADQAFTTANSGGALAFLTKATGAGLLTVRALIDMAGIIWFGETPGTATSKFSAGEAWLSVGAVIGAPVTETRVSVLDVHRFAAASTLSLYRANGTSGARTGVLATQTIAQLLAKGWDGTSAYVTGARIDVIALENYGVAAAGSYLSFLVSQTGAITQTERLRLYGSPAFVGVIGMLQVTGTGGAAATQASANTGIDLVLGLMQNRRSTIALGTPTGLNSSITMPGTSFAVITNTGAGAIIGGFATPAPRSDADGMEIELHAGNTVNVNGPTFTLRNEDASATNAGHRIMTDVGIGNAGDIANVRSCLLRYDGSLQRWRVRSYRV